MSTLPPSSAASSGAYLAAKGPALAALCTACGACFAACPIAPMLVHDWVVQEGVVQEGNARAVTAGLAPLARGEPADADTIAWLAACTKSGRCRSACPQSAHGLDAMLLIRIAKMQAIAVTGQLEGKRDQTAFPRVKTFARLQLTDEELEKWL